MAKLQSKLKNLPPQMVLKPCDIEFSKSFKNVEEGLMVRLKVSEIEVHIAATTVHTVMGKSLCKRIIWNRLKKKLRNFRNHRPIKYILK